MRGKGSTTDDCRSVKMDESVWESAERVTVEDDVKELYGDWDVRRV